MANTSDGSGNRLSSCPFCDGKPRGPVERHGQHCIECVDCGCDQWGETPEQAIAAWERRKSYARHIEERLTSLNDRWVRAERQWNRARNAIRRALADYVVSEGCSCCRIDDKHNEAQRRLAKLLDVTPYSDGSGFDFASFKTKKRERAR